MAKKSKHEPHPNLRVLPSMDLEDMAKGAYFAAWYHFSKINELLMGSAFTTLWILDPNIDEATKRQLQRQTNQFYYHIRAYFWELVAAFDTVLMWAKYKYQLKYDGGDLDGKEIDEGTVIWRNIRQSKSDIDADGWCQTKKNLEEAWDSEWYYEVRQYRNFAHRASLLGISEYKHGPDILEATFSEYRLIPARLGQRRQKLTTQLRLYLHEMRLLLEDVYPSTKDES